MVFNIGLFLFGALGHYTFNQIVGIIFVNKGKMEMIEWSLFGGILAAIAIISSFVLFSNLEEHSPAMLFFAFMPLISVLTYTSLGFLAFKFERNNFTADYEVIMVEGITNRYTINWRGKSIFWFISITPIIIVIIAVILWILKFG